VSVSLSVGVAVAQPGAVDTRDLLARADAALYAAKAGGRDLVHVDSNAEESEGPLSAMNGGSSEEPLAPVSG
jgi:predicted signal transduction protein with EAL and GGDEF domain